MKKKRFCFVWFKTKHNVADKKLEFQTPKSLISIRRAKTRFHLSARFRTVWICYFIVLLFRTLENNKNYYSLYWMNKVSCLDNLRIRFTHNDATETTIRVCLWMLSQYYWQSRVINDHNNFDHCNWTERKKMITETIYYCFAPFQIYFNCVHNSVSNFWFSFRQQLKNSTGSGRSSVNKTNSLSNVFE